MVNACMLWEMEEKDEKISNLHACPFKEGILLEFKWNFVEFYAMVEA